MSDTSDSTSDRDVARTGRVRSGRREPSSFINHHHRVHALVGRPRARSVYRSTARPRRGRDARDEAVSFFLRIVGFGGFPASASFAAVPVPAFIRFVRVTVRFGI